MKITAKKSIFGGLISFVIATSCCWAPWMLFLIGGASGSAILANNLGKLSVPFFLVAAAMLGYGVYLLMQKEKMKNSPKTAVLLESTITCPDCGHKKTEVMPTDACVHFYDCEKCKKLLSPKEGDCCVFCSYGTVPCPPIQLNADCC